MELARGPGVGPPTLGSAPLVVFIHKLIEMLNRTISFVLLVATAAAEVPAVTAARQWRETHERAIVQEFMTLLAIPNIATDQPNIRKNAALIQSMIEKRGMKSQLLEYPGASPVVFAELKNPDAKLTVVFYAHYDGQPLDPKEWVTPPFEPVLRNGPLDKDSVKVALPATGPINPEWRIFARSASDDKAPIIAILTALDAMKAAGIKPAVNLKLVFEGEEEAGSTNLGSILERNKELLKSDVWLICDGPVDQSRKRQIVFGARGVQTVDLTVYGPKRELHSGHYGNWAPNPAFMLTRLLASMKDDDGRVLIDGYYDGMLPLSDLDKKALAELPDNDPALKQELWLGRTEGNGKSLSELLTLPSLNIRGMGAARIGNGASNVIPASATATIDMRLVRGVTKDHVVDVLKKHIGKQGYFITDSEPGGAVRMAHPKVAYIKVHAGGYDAVRTPLDLPVAQKVVKAVEDAFGPVVKRPNTGGSVPLFMITEILGAPTIQTPIANHDNSQHTFNENIRIRNLWDGIEEMAALLMMR